MSLWLAALACGLIPAHAGKTRPSPCRWCRRGAHPRSRGENRRVWEYIPRPRGSSPLTRGKRSALGGRVVVGGLIPAHAGKTRAGRGQAWSPTAHPRSRGENVSTRISTTDHTGSSPLTRGKLVTGFRCLGSWGLIPAHAGKTGDVVLIVFLPGAHPRSRGENGTGRSSSIMSEGSSPLTRGKPVRAMGVANALGLIPAHAGKTPAPRESPARASAHPRSRGENAVIHGYSIYTRGSSPLTRGKHRERRLDFLDVRLIPAHAGKTLPDLRFYCADRSDLGKP